MTARLRELISHLDRELEVERFRDYGPNGLQVEGAPEVDRVVTGVSANLELFRRAAEWNADLIVVHHGLIWGPGIGRVVGPTAERLRHLLSSQTSLAAYHLPLDKHPRLGNNVGLADAIGLSHERGDFGDVRGHALGLSGSYNSSKSLDEVLALLSSGVLGGAAPQFVFPHGPAKVSKVGLCTGAASDLLEDAARAGCDLFVTGELAERAGELARELQISLVAAGHYATEVFGPRRLADEIARTFPDVEAQFIEVPSPL